MIRIPLLFWLLGLSVIFLFASEHPPLEATRVMKGPHLDGFLDDEVWQEALPFTAFKMVEPTPGLTPTEATELRILYDENNLYIGVHCFDGQPQQIAAHSMAHDNNLEGRSEDVIKILLDPFQDKRTAYLFFVNPRGAKSEGLGTGEHFSLNWDGIWDAKSRITETGWSAEIKIPFKTISFNPALEAWGLNLERYIPRKQETIRLSGIDRNSFFYNPREAALMHGISKIRQGLGLTFRPYGIVSAYKNHALHNKAQNEADGGFDLYKNFTPNLVGAVSVNTDFAETEVDERRINLTRFPLFFPEKRNFFLEGSEIFNFGISIDDDIVPFFSRRIGLYKGQQIPIDVGAKLYGKIGQTNLALVDVKTRSGAGLTEQNFFAGRVSQNIWTESRVGVVFTHGDPLGLRNRLLGADFLYNTARFFGNNNFAIGLWWLYNWNTLPTGTHHAYGCKIDYPNDLVDLSLTYQLVGDAIKPGLGYLHRSNYSYFREGARYQPRPTHGLLGDWVRQFFFKLNTQIYWDLSGRLESREIEIVPLSFRTESGENFELAVVPNRDVLPYAFEVSDGVLLPAKSYDFTRYKMELESASHRKIQLEAEYEMGEFYSGRLHALTLGGSLKYKGYMTIQISGSRVKGRLPEGDFNENVIRAKADLFLSPQLGLMNYIQYDDVSRELGSSSRLRWEISPGNLIFFVYNHSWVRQNDPRSRFEPQETRAVLKAQFSLRR